MSVRGRRGVGIPSVLLHEAEGTVVTIELKTGVLARGILQESEDNMNCHMKNLVLTDTDGKESHAKEIYIRGNQIRFIVFPEIFKFSPMFRRVLMAKKGINVAGGLGMGRTQAIRAKAAKKAILSKVQAKAPVGASAGMGGGGPGPGGPGMGAPPRPGMGASMGMPPRGPMGMPMPPQPGMMGGPQGPM